MNNSELVQSLVLDDSGDRKGFVFIMGDMNYRIGMQPEQVFLSFLLLMYSVYN